MSPANRPCLCLITIDTECSRGGWPWTPGKQPIGYETMLLGKIGTEEYGCRFIMKALEEHGLVAEFFVEPFCTHALGVAGLRTICQEIMSRGHGISLHPHPGWRAGLTDPPTRCSDMMYDYSVDEQEKLLREGLAIFADCGIEKVAACRAGNLGSSRTLYAAMRRVGIPISSNYCVAWNEEMPARHGLPATGAGVFQADGIWELPITSFRDWPRLRPRHLRPLQIAAASAAEITRILRLGCARQTVLVILLHSFELLRMVRGTWELDRRHLDRFLTLCKVLQSLQKHVRTCRFSDLGEADLRLFLAETRPGSASFLTGNDFMGSSRFVTHAVTRVIQPSVRRW